MDAIHPLKKNVEKLGQPVFRGQTDGHQPIDCLRIHRDSVQKRPILAVRV